MGSPRRRGPVGARVARQSHGVFVGISSVDYAARQTLTPRLDLISPYSVTGGCLSSAIGRLSYFYDWQGPCLSVDTA